MWLDRAWQVAAYSHEVDRTLLARRLLDKPVVLYRTAAGHAVALRAPAGPIVARNACR
jgi:phenylpropionate dioxygenase-like ring-hydroxylating dioxygenase large terminal subunit